MTIETVFFLVIEVNKHRSISVGIISMMSDTYNYIMSLSVAENDVDICSMGLHCICGCPLTLNFSQIIYKPHIQFSV